MREVRCVVKYATVEIKIVELPAEAVESGDPKDWLMRAATRYAKEQRRKSRVKDSRSYSDRAAYLREKQRERRERLREEQGGADA